MDKPEPLDYADPVWDAEILLQHLNCFLYIYFKFEPELAELIEDTNPINVSTFAEVNKEIARY